MWLFCASFVLVETAHGKSDAWKVRRTDRRPIVLKRIRKMLRKDPFSNYAFGQLKKRHRGRRTRKRLTRGYQKLVKRYPNRLHYKVVLARIYQWKGEHTKALTILGKVEQKKPFWLPLILRQISSLLALKRTQQAITKFKRALPRINSSKRRRLLKQLLDISLAAKDRLALNFALIRLKKLRWSYYKLQTIAVSLVRYQKLKEALYFYHIALRKIHGGSKVKLLLEVCRLEMRLKRYEKARGRLEEAKKFKTTHIWLKWEILESEIELSRRTGELNKLVQKLRKKWAETKDYRKLIVLARLFHELKKHDVGFKFDRKALKVKPKQREPRDRMIKWYTQKKKMKSARHHIEKLIRYGTASPHHYRRWTSHLLRQSKRPPIPRWNPAWKVIWSRYRSEYEKKRSWRHWSKYGAYSNQKSCPDRFRVHPKSWEMCRQARWLHWRKNARPFQRNMLNKAIKRMTKYIRKNAFDWDVLTYSEQTFGRFGFPKEAKMTRDRMDKAVGVELHRLQQMKRLYQKLQKSRRFENLLIRVLKTRTRVPSKADNIAQFAYRQGLQKRLKTPRQYRRKRRRRRRRKASGYKPLLNPFCPRIKKFLKPVTKSLVDSYTKQHPLVVVRLLALSFRCGSKDKKNLKLLRTLEGVLLRSQKGTKALFTTYALVQYDAGIDRFLSKATEPVFNAAWSAFIQQYRKKPFATALFRFLLSRITRHRRKQPTKIYWLLSLLCREKTTCASTRHAVQALVKHKDLDPHELLPIIEKMGSFRLFSDERLSWLQIIYKRFRKDLRVLKWVMEHERVLNPADGELFEYGAFAQMHRKYLLRVLQLLTTRPVKFRDWLDHCVLHLYHLRTRGKQKMRFLKGLDKAVKRFPKMYRELLDIYFRIPPTRRRYSSIRYRDFGRRALRRWLMRPLLRKDLLLLERYYHYLALNNHRKKEQYLLKVLSKQHRPEMISWMEHFARPHKKNHPRLRKKALYRLVHMRPKDPKVLARLVKVLDDRELLQVADTMWLRLNALRPQSQTLPQLKKRIARCCSGKNARNRMRRLLHLAQGKYPFKKLWPLYMKLLPRLNSIEVAHTIRQLRKYKTLQNSHRTQLADLAYRKGHNTLAISLYLVLLRQAKTRALFHRRLGLLYDRTYQLRQASYHWKQFFTRQYRIKAATFHNAMAHGYLQQGKTIQAAISYYRLFSRRLPPKKLKDKHRRKVRYLREQRQPVKAWAYWLWLQGEKAASQCLNRKSPYIPHAYGVPVTLWSQDLSYKGPLLFFGHCRWEFPTKSTKKMLKKLALYLQRNQKRKITLFGSASSRYEPDFAFLAQERTYTIQRVLEQLGIRKSRILFQRAKARCGRKDNHHKRIRFTCLQFQRQISIGSFHKTPGLYASRDVDGDGTPDFQDECPLETADTKRYGYGSRARSNGCPKKRDPFIKGHWKGQILFSRTIHIAENPYATARKNTEVSLQIRRLLLLAPQLKYLQIKLSKLPTYRSSYSLHKRFGQPQWQKVRSSLVQQHRDNMQRSLAQKHLQTLKRSISQGLQRKVQFFLGVPKTQSEEDGAAPPSFHKRGAKKARITFHILHSPPPKKTKSKSLKK